MLCKCRYCKDSNSQVGQCCFTMIKMIAIQSQWVGNRCEKAKRDPVLYSIPIGVVVPQEDSIFV